MHLETLYPDHECLMGKADLPADEVGFDYGNGNLDVRIYSLQNYDGTFIKCINLQPDTLFLIRAFGVIGNTVYYGNIIEAATDSNSKFLETSYKH